MNPRSTATAPLYIDAAKTQSSSSSNPVSVDLTKTKPLLGGIWCLKVTQCKCGLCSVSLGKVARGQVMVLTRTAYPSLTASFIYNILQMEHCCGSLAHRFTCHLLLTPLNTTNV